MISRAKLLVAGGLVVWATVLGYAATGTQGSAPLTAATGGLYSKAQADAAKARFDKICADCHAFDPAAKKRPTDLPLGGEPFLKRWNGRTIDELVTLIVMTMPNDGSAVVNDSEALDLVAYILQQNGFPAGRAPLTRERASATLGTPKK